MFSNSLLFHIPLTVTSDSRAPAASINVHLKDYLLSDKLSIIKLASSKVFINGVIKLSLTKGILLLALTREVKLNIASQQGTVSS